MPRVVPLQWVGSPCGLHGPYVFYKAFRCHRGGRPRIVALGDFFPVRCGPGEPLCVAELQLLWEERTHRQLLSSSKLYFLPEDTPAGRDVNHGEDEVIAVSEKVIVRLEDLVKWTVWDPKAWTRGMRAVALNPGSGPGDPARSERRDAPPCLRFRESTLNSGLNFKDVLKEKAELGEDGDQRPVLVLSYPQYCRYRAVAARLQERPVCALTEPEVLALGGVAGASESTCVLYCRDTFDHPTLLLNECVCDEFAPNLKGRPRKKRPSLSQRRDSQGPGQGSEVKEATEGKNRLKVKVDRVAISKSRGSSSDSGHISKRALLQSSEQRKERGGGGRGGGGEPEDCRAEEQAFLVCLYKYMKERKTPIERIPYLGFKQINLWTMFQAAQKLGGYELITARRQWKNVYDELGGNPGSTSAATCTRRHYERLILPYERFTRGEEDKPLPPAKPRKPETGSASESLSADGGPALKNKATNGVKPHSHKPRPEKDVVTETKDQNVRESAEKAHHLKLEAQILVTPLKPHQLPRAGAEKQRAEAGDGETASVIRLVLNEEEDGSEEGSVRRRRRRRRSSRSGCEPQEGDQASWEAGAPCFPTLPMAMDNSGLFQLSTQLSTPLDLWRQEEAEPRDQCHVGMVSPAQKHRDAQSATVPDPPVERADAHGREDTFLGFASLLYPPRVHLGIMSPLAKKKLLSQVSEGGLANHNHFPSPYGPPPPLIRSGLTNGVSVEAAGQPVASPNLPAMMVNRPSVIQHVQSFKARGEGAEERKEASKTDRTEGEERETSTLHAHRHQLPSPPLQPSVLHAHSLSRPVEPYHRPPSPPRCGPGRTPPGFVGDHYCSPASHVHNPFRKTESHLSQAPEQGLRHGLGLGPPRKGPQVEGQEAHPDSEPHNKENLFCFSGGSLSSEAEEHYRHLPHYGSGSASEPDYEDSKHRQQQALSLHRDAERFPRSVPCSHHDSSHFTGGGLQDKQATNSDQSRAMAADEQPTDLSLPKSSPLKSFSHPSPLPSLRCRTPCQENTHLSHDATMHPLSQNMHSMPGVAYHPRACRVPPLTVSQTHTPSHSLSPRRGMAVDAHPRVTEKTGNSHVDKGRLEKERGERGEAGDKEAVDIYSKMKETASGVKPRPLKRPLEEAENGLPERKIRAVMPMHTSSSASSPSPLESSKDVVAYTCDPRKSHSLDELGDFSRHAAGVSKSPGQLHIGDGLMAGSGEGQMPLIAPVPTTPHIFPAALYPAGAFSLSQMPDLCGDLCPPSPSHPHHGHQYLKSKSATVLSPLVPPFAIHSLMMQRQLLAHAAASPAHMYQHPMGAAASYGDLLHYGFYPMSINPQPAFSPPQLSSVHPSTKLS